MAFRCGAWGAASRAAAGRGAAVQACLPRFRQRGGWSANVFGRWSNDMGPRVGRWARGTNNLNKCFFFLLPRCMFGGQKKGEQCRSKRHRSALFPFSFFFLIKCMKRRRFGENAPFHLKPAKRQNASIYKAALNHLLSFQLHPCRIRTPSLYLAAFFTLVLGL